MVIRYRGTSPKLGSCQGECPYPCDYISFFVVGGGGVVDYGSLSSTFHGIGSPSQKDDRVSRILKSATETARNENRGYLHDTVIKTFGRIYNEFLPTKIRIVQENGVRRAHEVLMRQGARPGGQGAPSTLVEASCPPWTATYFSIFLNIPKRRNIALKIVLESVYLRTTYLFLFGVQNVLESVPYAFHRGYGFNNIGLNIYRIT